MQLGHQRDLQIWIVVKRVAPITKIFIEQGSTNADKMFQLTTNSDITIDTTSLTFAEYGGGGGGTGDIEGVTAGTGLTGGGSYNSNIKCSRRRWYYSKCR